MKYVIVTIQWCLSKGIVVPDEARKSIDGTKVILHHGFIQPVLTEDDEINIYQHDSAELSEILNGEEWTVELSEILNDEEWPVVWKNGTK